MIKVDAKSTPTFFYNLKRRPCDKMGFVPLIPCVVASLSRLLLDMVPACVIFASTWAETSRNLMRRPTRLAIICFFLHIFSGRIEKGSVASRRAWHFDSCCSVCSFVHVGSLRACTDSRKTHVPALARRCKTHDTGAIKLSFSLAD
jgi:hypothetical protein